MVARPLILHNCALLWSSISLDCFILLRFLISSREESEVTPMLPCITSKARFSGHKTTTAQGVLVCLKTSRFGGVGRNNTLSYLSSCKFAMMSTRVYYTYIVGIIGILGRLHHCLPHMYVSLPPLNCLQAGQTEEENPNSYHSFGPSSLPVPLLLVTR